MIAAPVVETSAGLDSASELVVLVFEQDVERSERFVLTFHVSCLMFEV